MAKAEDVETPNSGRVCGTRQLFPIWKCSVWALVALALLSAVRPHDCHESSPLLASYLSLS